MDFLNSYDEDEEEFEEKKEEFSIPFGLPTKFGGQQSTTTKIQPNTIFDNDDEKNEIVDQEFNENESDANIYEDYDDNKDDHDFSHHSDGNVADDTDSFAVEHKIPVSHQVDLGGHEKAVTCLCIEPAGNRVVTGSFDYNMKMYDFGGMDSRHRAFRSIEPDCGHPVTCIANSPSGDRFVIATGTSHCIVYDREGTLVIKFSKGDMYLRDLSHTKGHTMEITGIQWHPTDKNLILTSSMDGSMRVWDLLGEAHFGNLMCTHVLKLKASTGQGRLGVTACAYSPNGQKLIGGTSDGSIQIFFEKKIFSRPDIVIRPAHRIDTSIISLTVSSDGDLLASRGSTDETVFVWNLSKFSMATGNTNFKPILEMRGLPNDYPTANVEFSPDGKFICCGTTPLKKPARTGKYTATGTVTGPTTNNTDVTGESEHAGANTSSSSLLCFFDIHTAQQTYKLLSKSMTTSTSANGSGKGIGGTNTKSGQHIEYNSSTEPLVVEPCMTIGVIKDASVIAVKWQAKTNQIFCSTSFGLVRIFFDPRFSVKGALITSSRAPKRAKDPSDFAAVGEIINPHALPMYRSENHQTKKRSAKDMLNTKAPARPVDLGTNRGNTSFFFTQYVMQGHKKDDLRSEDPREALLKMDSIAKADPMFLGNAYATSQPQAMMHTMTFEEEQEDFKKKQKKVL